MTVTNTLLTPKDLADAIGASESSLRRWVDSGRIRMSRTAGGHRRIALEDALRFVRESGSTVVRPDILGMGLISPAIEPETTDSQRLYRALVDGDRALARSLVILRYLGGMDLAQLFDGPVADAMYRVGELWKHDVRGILTEHRATEICLQVIAELKALVPAAPADAPVSIGGAPSGDPYLAPTMMVGAVMQDAGYRDINYGPNTPIELLADASREQNARLVWLSMSSKPPKSLPEELAKLAEQLRAAGADLLLGGRHVDAVAPKEKANVHVVRSMRELRGFVAGLKRT